MKRFYILGIVTLAGFLIVEIALRKAYGFCDAVLIKEDKDLEYLPVAGQDRFRFGNHIYYNRYSMRSPEISESDSLHILGLGDSVINGGTLLEQDSIATSIISRNLSDSLKRQTLLLNISAGSWGPDNIAAYLRKFGDFNARLMLLVVSSHDAHDNMEYQKIVGVSPDFPSRQYPLAILEVWDRYLWPRYIKPVFSRKQERSELGINKHATAFNSGFSSLHTYSIDQQIPFIIYLHPETSEIKAGNYNRQGQEIIAFCIRNNIRLIRGLEKGMTESYYHDIIHLNVSGQKALAKVLTSEILQDLR